MSDGHQDVELNKGPAEARRLRLMRGNCVNAAFATRVEFEVFRWLASWGDGWCCAWWPCWNACPVSDKASKGEENTLHGLRC